MSENEELEQLRRLVGSARNEAQTALAQAHKARGEALACSLLLTQMLRSIEKRDVGLVRDSLDIPLTPSTAPIAPIRRIAEGLLKELIDLFRR